jgi:surface protein
MYYPSLWMRCSTGPLLMILINDSMWTVVSKSQETARKSADYFAFPGKPESPATFQPKFIHCRRSANWCYRCYNYKMSLTVTDDIQLELPEELARVIMSYWDVPTLVRNKAVCLTWKRLCTAVIDDKAPIPRQAFLSGDELRSAVIKYARYNATQAEEFATTYGWPIGNWDVSKVHDFSRIFKDIKTFNEEIGSWDVSNATAMAYMFTYASSFNGDLSLWDTSNVTHMHDVFYNATSFN